MLNGNLCNYYTWQSAPERDFERYGHSIRQDQPLTLEEEESDTLSSKHTSRKRLEEQNIRNKGQSSEERNTRKGLEDEGESLSSKFTSHKGLEKQECNTRKGQDMKVRFKKPESQGQEQPWRFMVNWPRRIHWWEIMELDQSQPSLLSSTQTIS